VSLGSITQPGELGAYRSRPHPAAVAAYAVSAVALLAALYFWEARSYIDQSDGVYAYTARAALQGRDLYGEIAAAQPPTLYWLGAGILAVHDSVWGLRAGLSVVLLLTSALVAFAVWRLTAHAVVAGLAGVLSMLAPWTLHEHTALLPETLAAPLLLAGAVASARPRTAVVGGALLAVAVTAKLAFLVPGAAVILAASPRRRCLLGFALSLTALALVFAAAYGSELVDNAIVAQLQSGRHAFRDVVELLVQTAWNEVPLVLVAALAWRYRRDARDPELLRSLLALTIGAGLLVTTFYKQGTVHQVLVVLEAPACALAASGALWFARDLRSRSRSSFRERVLAVTVVGCVALLVSQSVSFLVSPTNPALFPRPSGPELGWLLGDDEVDAAVAEAKRCAPGLPYSGPPYLAFAARRTMPGGQADRFIISSDVNARFARAVRAARVTCP
jgi:hypothetical protein